MESRTTDTVSLTQATADLMARIEHANARARVVGLITIFLVTILIALGVAGIYKQNTVAANNKNHIDCIIKDLSTPLPPGAKARVIDYQTRLSADCKIKFN